MSATLGKGFTLRKELAITHAHYVFPSDVVTSIKKLFGIPYIVTAHGGDIERMAKKSARIRSWTQQILQESAHVIAVGPVLAQQIEQDFQISRDKISIYSMGVNRDVFKPAHSLQIRSELGLSPEPFIFLFVGNVIGQKGVEELLHAFHIVQKRSHKQVELIIVGSRRDTVFIEHIQPLLNDNVKLVDPVQQLQLVKYFQASNVFVLPSHLEGFGLVALEALATGIPVIASDVGGLTSLLGNGAGQLVPAKNVAALAEEMVRALNTPAEQYCNKQAIEEVLQLHDEHNITAQMIAIYKSATKDGDSI